MGLTIHTLRKLLTLYLSVGTVSWRTYPIGSHATSMPSDNVKTIPFVFYDSAYDNVPKRVEAPWPELCSWLTSHTLTTCTVEGTPCANKSCTSKFGPAWSPVDYGDDEDPVRDNSRVQAVTLAVLDLDHLPDVELERIALAIDGYAYIFHSTHCHQPPDNGSYRLIMQLSHPVPAGAWRSVLKAIIELLGIPADPQCKDLSRLYFLPSAPVGTPLMGEIGEGKPLDVVTLLERAKATRDAPKPAAPQSLDAPALGTGLPAVTSGLEDLRKSLVGQRVNYSRSPREGDKERAELLGRVIYGTPLAAEGARDNTVNQCATLIAQAVPVETPVEAVLELMRPALSGMPLDPEGLDHWIERARYSFERAIERRSEWEAQIKTRNAELTNRLRALAPPSSDGVPVLAPELLEADPDVWKSLLKVTVNKAGEETIISCGHNAVVILAYSPECRGAFKFNEVTKAIELWPSEAPGAECPFIGTPIATLDVTVVDWLYNNYEIKLHTKDVAGRIARVARLNAYDPLALYLRGLQWDGVPRIDTWLETYAGALTTDELDHDVTSYVRKVSARWLISAAARGLYPGCKVDTCLVLEGLQGLGKSTLFDVLGGSLFSGSPVRIESKDGQMVGARFWIVELAELTHLSKTAVEAQKAFLSQRQDDLRAPYAAVLESFPRRCVFAGTTNADKYLTDSTGNRRYWPIACRNTDIDETGLRRDRDQLWAEAVHRLHNASSPELDRQVKGPHAQGAGERWWFLRHEQSEADQQANARMVETPVTAIISDWWFSLSVDKRGPLRAHEVALQALKMTPDRINKAVQMDVAAALRTLGFIKTVKWCSGSTVAVWAPTDELKNAMPTKTGTLMRSIVGARLDPGGTK